MRKILVLACALALSGCAWLGFGDDSDSTATAEPMQQETQAEETAPAEKPAPAQKKYPAKVKKGAKSETQIKAALDVMGKKLAAQAARTLVPNKARPEYRQAGGEWIAKYIDVDPDRVVTSMTPSSGVSGEYVGRVSYVEKIMECRGATKAAALKGSCVQVKTANRTELIRYDGKEWQD